MIDADQVAETDSSSFHSRLLGQESELVVRSSRSELRRANWLWAGGFVTVMAIHLLWATANQMPAIWDMAHHQFMGWLYLASFQDGGLLADLSSISSYYPPLYYLQESFVMALTGPSRFLAWLANLPGLVLLSFFSYRMALLNCRPVSAVGAGVVVLLLPLVAWTSRETLLDPTLAGWVTLALFLVLKSRFLQSNGWTLLFGLVVAAGMLTKWTFAVFLIAPVLFSFYRRSERGRVLRNLLDAVLVSLPLIFWWYLPNLGSLWQRFKLTALAAVSEQDPGLSSFWGWIYYPRSLSSYYLFFLLSVALGWALFLLLRRPIRLADSFLLWTALGGVLLLSALKAKDPRYVMPLVSPIVIILIGAFDTLKGRLWVSAIVLIAFLQFLAVSFSFSPISGKLAFFELEDDTDYLGMGREWVLYSSDYFGVLGPPRVEAWHHAEIARHFESGTRVGFVPDAVRFNPATLRLFAVEQGIQPNILRIGDRAEFMAELESLDWMVGKTGEQGISYITRYNEQVYDAVEARNWRLVEKWNLPDGTEAVLWQNPTHSQ